jgi:hypothetical protein
MRQYRHLIDGGKRYAECQWNGPSWPFDTTLVLDGMANLLNDYTQDVIHADDYIRLLKQYTRQHFLRDHHPDLQEDYNPDTGKVIVGLPRSHHYNHSEYNDLIVTGLAGLRPRSDNTLEINPLVGTDERSTNSINYFCLEDVPYHGQLVTILYDRDGGHYNKGSGLSVYVNGLLASGPSALGRKTISISVPVVHAPLQPIDLAVNYVKDGFPAPSASINDSAADIYQAVDGRVWFYPEVRNYWSNTGSTAAEDWFSLDFGVEKQFSSVQLYFYGDEAKFKAPEKYAVEYWTGGNWADVSGARMTPEKPWANGENHIAFDPIKTSKLRFVFTNTKEAAVALVEVKAFE